MTLLSRHSNSEKTIAGYYHKLQSNFRQHITQRHRQKIKRIREQQRVQGAVEAIIEGTDVRLRGLRNYQKELSNYARDLLEHIEGLVASMPPPLLIDSRSLYQDPLARILLSDIQVVQRLLIRNQDIQDFFSAEDDRTRDEVFALMFIRHREKTALGSEIHGDMILREVRQTCLGLYGHRLVGPSKTEAEVRFEMLVTLFESVIRYIKDKFLQEKKTLLNANSISALPPSETRITNPKVYLSRLTNELSTPTQLIKLEDSQVRVSKLGIKLELESSMPSDLLKLHTIQVGDADSCVVTMIRYPRDGITAVDGFGMI
ncbi:MAG: hypothetical protein QNJ78_07115 [Gammaproteobacteria bacterium]|nr:hypothetical protein [Gammaproteobacteria bacterium]